ncbi:ATP-binding protein [Marinomonas balearica]|uniref:ATPase family protein associated with various cellular activities (AAA) n=1 Tax=Marinomonas balearica TaxID=491947 RepID=A0A4R6M5W9_9GAMM|nr:ATP-binding protein [Marinomonas balearica]TDO96713.1 ATPase family protein associated with various cellular activities (AAA) [Marinomonas balearica]
MVNFNVTPIKKPSVALSDLQWNAKDLTTDIAWCEQIINVRLNLYFNQETSYSGVSEVIAPNVASYNSPYGLYLQQANLTFVERLALVLALLPAVKPSVLDVFLYKNEATERPYTEFGCQELGGCIYATGETLAFLIGCDALEDRFNIQKQLYQQAQSAAFKLLQLKGESDDVSLMKIPFQVKDEYLHLFTISEPYRPDLSQDFPAKRVVSGKRWQDLNLPDATMEQLEDIRGWIKHGHKLKQDWGFGNKIRPGYRALFHGQPGTGKTMAACLLGESTGSDVYQVDLSLITSKYIGETEKNLEKVFSMAEDKSWILFFDEADALFGKRTESNSANDQFANQNVAYLLQRIEAFNGVVILASNYKNNLDEAFFRRFEAVVYFKLPDAAQRLSLWKSGFSDKSSLESSIDLSHIAKAHELSAAAIMNVIRYTSLKAVCDDRTVILAKDINAGIQQQLGNDERNNALSRF